MNAVEIRLEALRLATPFVSIPAYPIAEPAAQDTAKSIVVIAGAFEAFLTGSGEKVACVAHSTHAAAVAHTSAGQTQQTAAPHSEQPLAPQADAPVAKTPNDVNLAFVAYVKKGQGRTAATAKAVLTKYGINSFKEANPEQCAQLVAEYEAA